MNKEELIEFLKENLRIKTEIVSSETSYSGPYSHSVKVSILLGDKVISESESDTFD